MKIYDPFGRPIENLRIIVTTRCNYNCIYCHAEGFYDPTYFGFEADGNILLNKRKELSPEDVYLIGKVARFFGIKKVKITGGEPLLHKDILKIISVLRDLGFEDISMVTNGFFLADMAYELKEAGLNRVNVSLVSLRGDVFEQITRVKNALPRVLEGIQVAKSAGLEPIKINMVVLKGFNESEIDAFIDFARRNKVILQLIEYHAPPSNKRALERFYRPLADIEEKLRNIAVKIITRRMHARKQYILRDGTIIEIVRPLFNPAFCANCIRIRATPIGWKPCLLRNIIVNYEEELSRRDLRGLVRKFLKAIALREPFFK